MKFLVTLARTLVGCPPPRGHRRQREETGDEIAARMPPFLPDQNPLQTLDGSGARQMAALKMMDGDCYGFLLLTVHRDVGVRGRIELAAHLRPEWEPAITATLERIIDAERVAT